MTPSLRTLKAAMRREIRASSFTPGWGAALRAVSAASDVAAALAACLAWKGQPFIGRTLDRSLQESITTKFSAAVEAILGAPAKPLPVEAASDYVSMAFTLDPPLDLCLESPAAKPGHHPAPAVPDPRPARADPWLALGLTCPTPEEWLAAGLENQQLQATAQHQLEALEWIRDRAETLQEAREMAEGGLAPVTLEPADPPTVHNCSI